MPVPLKVFIEFIKKRRKREAARPAPPACVA
jgi:hypothetical protein